MLSVQLGPALATLRPALALGPALVTWFCAALALVRATMLKRANRTKNGTKLFLNRCHCSSWSIRRCPQIVCPEVLL